MRKLNQKGFGAVEVLLVIAIVGIIGGVGWYVFRRSSNTNPLVSTSALPKSVSNFYFADDTGTISYYNPNTDKKSDVITKLPLTENRFLTTSDAGSNQPVQIVNEGHKIFYSNAKPKPGASLGGEGEPERESTIISMLANKQESKVVVIKAPVRFYKAGILRFL